MTQYVVHSPTELQHACCAAAAGDEILVCGGVYDRASALRGRRGQPGRPIVLKAADEHWISGGQAPDPYWGGTFLRSTARANPKSPISRFC